MLQRALQYADLGYTTISVGIEWNVDLNTKKLTFKSGWPQSGLPTACYHPHIDPSSNGLAIVTGPKSDLVVIDCDRAKSVNVVDGLDHFHSLVSMNGLPDNTPVALSGSVSRRWCRSCLWPCFHVPCTSHMSNIWLHAQSIPAHQQAGCKIQ